MSELRAHLIAGPADAPQREACAWFVAGGDPEHLLETIARHFKEHTNLRLYPMPRSAADRSLAGVLVLPPTGVGPVFGHPGMAFGRIGQSLLLPVEAELHPPVTAEELKQATGSHLLVFHPAFGLVAFDESSALRVWDLIELPPFKHIGWNAARPGLTFNHRLRSIAHALTLPPDQIFGEESKDIGSESPKDLPPLSDEPGDSAASEAARRLREITGKSVSYLTRLVPHTGTKRTWIKDLEDWANRQSQPGPSNVDRQREKELNRLLDLLAKDPDKGLRHALPMNHFGHRGRAPAGGQLGDRTPEFDLNRIGAGGPADYWNVPQDMQEKLRQAYRELASRDLRLGRFLRAAYIYAELLGDLVSGAAALKQGRHFRAAAVLYHNRLGNPLEAARCLAEGGLVSEAIAIYEERGLHVEAAELYLKIGDMAGAERCFRLEVAKQLLAGDRLKAAQLLDRIGALEEALTTVLGGWPESTQAIACLREGLRRLQSFQRHTDVAKLIGELRHQPLPPATVTPLCQMLANFAEEQADAALRHQVEDIARIRVGQRLGAKGLRIEEAQELTRALARLAPGDRLLKRDGNRHVQKLREQARALAAAKPPPLPQPMSAPVLVRSFKLGKSSRWYQARGEGSLFYAIGSSMLWITAVRGTWDGQEQAVSWSPEGGIPRQDFVFLVPKDHSAEIIISLPEALKTRRFAASDLFFNSTRDIGTPTWWPSEALCATANQPGMIWHIHVAAGCAVLSGLNLRGELVTTYDVSAALLESATRTEETRLSLTALPGLLAVALGNRLALSLDGGEFRRFELPSQVISLVPTNDHMRRGVVAVLEAGAVMLWADHDELVVLDRDLSKPKACFTSRGEVLLVSNKMGLVCDVDRRGVQKSQRFITNQSAVISVTPADQPNHFAIFGENGEVEIWRVEL